MNNPYLTSKLHVRVRLLLSLNPPQSIDCLIDTGYSDGILLPTHYMQYLRNEPLGHQQYELADGTNIKLPIYEIRVTYSNRTKYASLVFTKSNDALVGIEFLRGFKLTLDLKKNQVTLT